MEGDVRTSHTGHLSGEAIQYICGSVDPFYPVCNTRFLHHKFFTKLGVH
jgi:hypothetical protein